LSKGKGSELNGSPQPAVLVRCQTLLGGTFLPMAGPHSPASGEDGSLHRSWMVDTKVTIDFQTDTGPVVCPD